MRISDWSSDVCSSDLLLERPVALRPVPLCMAGEAAQHAADEGAHLLELGAAEAARGGRRRAEADAGGHRRLIRIEGDAGLVAGDAGAVEALSGDVAGQDRKSDV